MDDNLKRARELLPAIVITVLSMIQALALELFWTRFQESDYLWQGGWDALIGWLQFALLLAGIVQVWLVYVSLMLRFTWLPGMGDTSMPFAIGLLEFALISMIGPATLGPWVVCMGLLFGLAITATRLALRKARRDPTNDWFFSHFASAGWRDYLGDGITMLVMLSLGALLWIRGGGNWLALGSLLFAMAALAWQLLMTHRYWLPALGQGGEDESEP
jgi:hypothetical protein